MRVCQAHHRPRYAYLQHILEAIDRATAHAKKARALEAFEQDESERCAGLGVRLRPFITGFYANLTYADQDAMKSHFGPNLPRLVQIKKQYDPHNFFRLNPNIPRA
jgi:hypothetical protein